jgi:general secretion pathway protein I
MSSARATMAWLRNPHRSNSIEGFTLLEVLVALAVIAVALAALVSAATTQVKVAERTRDKAVAGWVASNVFTEMKLREPFPEPGERTGTVSMANQRFAWRALVQSTQESDLRRIDLRISVKVDGAADQPVLTRTEFAGRQ